MYTYIIGDDEEISQTGVDEKKPVIIKSQHSLDEEKTKSNDNDNQNESNDNDKKNDNDETIQDNVEEGEGKNVSFMPGLVSDSDDNKVDSDGGGSNDTNNESNDNNKSNDDSKEDNNDNNGDKDETKVGDDSNDNKDSNNDKNEYDCAYSYKVNDDNKNDNQNSDVNDDSKSNKKKNSITSENKLVRPRTAATSKQLRSNSDKKNVRHSRVHTCPVDKFNSTGSNDPNKNRKMKKLQFDKENNNKNKNEINNTKTDEKQNNENGEEEYPKNNRNATTASTVGSKGSKASKGSTKKKNNKNNYRAFVSIQPSCNRYMANMWNNYVYSIHKMNILNIKKTVDNEAPKKYTHIDQKLKTKQLKKERDDEIRRDNQNILNRMIYQGRNNVGTSNLDDNNEVIEPVFRSLNAEKNRRLEIEKNKESQVFIFFLIYI